MLENQSIYLQVGLHKQYASQSTSARGKESGV